MCESNSVATPSALTNKRIAVVGGGGISGLQTLRALKARGFSNVVAYEGSDKLGGVWRSNYSNFSVQLPRELFEFQDFPMDDIGWQDYATGVNVQKYMEAYASAFDIMKNIEFSAYVTRVQLQADKKWLIEIKFSENGDMKKRTEIFDYVVIASGLYCQANQFIPSIPGKEHFKGKIVHSCDFRDASIAKDKRVVVIGGGKSANDTAVEAAVSNAKSVTHLCRTLYWPSPRNVWGIIPTHMVLCSRLGTNLVCTQTGTFPTGSVLSKYSRILALLTRPIYRFYEFLVAWQFNLKGSLYPQADVIRGFYNVHLSVNDDHTNLRKQGQIDMKVGEIDEFKDDGTTLVLKDGSTVSADLVVSATGFRENYSFFEDPTKLLDIEDDGVYLYRYILPKNVPNLAFIGHVNAVSNICTYGLQAEWLARYLAQDLVEEPTSEKISTDIEARKEWARRFMPESKIRGMTILLHQAHYWDLLLSDMGVNPYRKSNIFAEYLMVYGPADYSGIIGIPAPKENKRKIFPRVTLFLKSYLY